MLMLERYSKVAPEIEISLALSTGMKLKAGRVFRIFAGTNKSGVIKQVLQNNLSYVEQWLQENKLVLNQSETKWMLLGTRQKLEHSSDIAIQSQGQKIERVSSFCYLGVTLDEHLSWNEHVEIICHKVSKRLGLLSRI